MVQQGGSDSRSRDHGDANVSSRRMRGRILKAVVATLLIALLGFGIVLWRPYVRFGRLTPEMQIRRGKNFLAAGDTASAEKCFRSAVELAERDPDGLEATVTSLQHLASALDAQGRSEAAEGALLHAVHKVKQDSPSNVTLVGQTIRELGWFYLKKKRFDLARKRYQEVLRMYENHFGARHPHTALVLSDLGLVAQMNGQDKVAENLYERVLSCLEPVVDSHLGDYLTVSENLAILYMNRGAQDKAKRVVDRAVDVFETRTGGRVRIPPGLQDLQKQID